MEIRKCTMADLVAVAAMYDKAVLHLEETVNYPKWEYGVYPSEKSVARAIQQGVQYVCKENESVLGAFILNEDPQGDYGCGDWTQELSTGEYLVIHTLAVVPNSFGLGIGKQIVRFCAETAQAQGFKAIRIDVVPENIPARRLYEKMGFSFAGEKDLLRNIPEIPLFALYELNFMADKT